MAFTFSMPKLYGHIVAPLKTIFEAIKTETDAIRARVFTPPFLDVTTTPYAVGSQARGGTVGMRNASANVANFTATSIATIGDWVKVTQTGAGTTSIGVTGAGVTINGGTTPVALAARGDTVIVTRIADNAYSCG